MKFKITHHSGFSAPPDALERLFERLPARSDAVSFSKASHGITATWAEDGHGSRPEEELAAIGRLEVLEVVSATCEGDPSLTTDWFAISRLR